MSGLLLLAVLTLFGADDAGTTAFPLLRVPVGPRACALGESYSGYAADVCALYWNPAGLGCVPAIQVAVSHQEWFADIRDENASAAIPAGPGCVGAGLVYSAVGNIETWDPVTNEHLLRTARSGYATLGYGMPLSDHLSVGIVVKGLYDNLIEQTGLGACVDAGLLYRPIRRLRLGLAGQHLGWGMRYGTDDIPLPATIRLGTSLELPHAMLVLDALAASGSRPEVHAGAEYSPNDVLCLRAGYRLGPQDWQTLSWTSGITTGLGLNIGPLALDYSFTPYGGLGFAHRLALRASFAASLTGRLHITAHEFKTGAPVKADFVLTGVPRDSYRLEADGSCIVEGLRPGRVQVTATADGFYPHAESALIEARTRQDLRVVMRRSGHGSLWVVVHADDTHRPLAAEVRCVGTETTSVVTSDTTGSVAFRKLRAGAYDIVVAPLDSAYAPLRDTVTIPTGRLVSRSYLMPRLGRSALCPIPLAAPPDRTLSVDETPVAPSPPQTSPPSVQYGTFDE